MEDKLFLHEYEVANRTDVFIASVTKFFIHFVELAKTYLNLEMIAVVVMFYQLISSIS